MRKTRKVFRKKGITKRKLKNKNKKSRKIKKTRKIQKGGEYRQMSSMDALLFIQKNKEIREIQKKLKMEYNKKLMKEIIKHSNKNIQQTKMRSAKKIIKESYDNIDSDNQKSGNQKSDNQKSGNQKSVSNYDTIKEFNVTFKHVDHSYASVLFFFSRI